MKGQLRIEEMFAFVVTDDDNTEGILSMETPMGHMPLVGADMARVESLRPVALAIGRTVDKPVKLLRFSNRTEEWA